MMVDGIPNRPLYFYQKDNIGSTTLPDFVDDVNRFPISQFFNGHLFMEPIDIAHDQVSHVNIFNMFQLKWHVFHDIVLNLKLVVIKALASGLSSSVQALKFPFEYIPRILPNLPNTS